MQERGSVPPPGGVDGRGGVARKLGTTPERDLPVDNRVPRNEPVEPMRTVDRPKQLVAIRRT
jgi:hypothetical protein